MSTEPTFDELLQAAPKRDVKAVISLIGKLFQSEEAGGFVIVTADGASIALKSADVQSHAVLGYADGQALVRIDVNSGALPAQGDGAQPFSLATGGGVPLQSHHSGTLGDVNTPPSYEVVQAHGSGTLGDVGTVASADVALQAHASGTLGDVGCVPSYDIALQAHASGTLGDVGTVYTYDVALQAHASGTLGDVGCVPSYDIALQAHASGTLGDVGTVYTYDVA